MRRFTILQADSPRLEEAFLGAFTASRFLLSFASAGLASPAALLFLGLVSTFGGSLALVFAQEVSPAAVWAGVIAQSVSYNL